MTKTETITTIAEEIKDREWAYYDGAPLVLVIPSYQYGQHSTEATVTDVTIDHETATAWLKLAPTTDATPTTADELIDMIEALKDYADNIGFYMTVHRYNSHTDVLTIGTDEENDDIDGWSLLFTRPKNGGTIDYLDDIDEYAIGEIYEPETKAQESEETENTTCDVCGKPAEFEGGTINADGSITESHLCGDCLLAEAQQEQERDDLSEFVYTEHDGIRLAHMIVDFYELKDDFEASTDTDETTSIANRAEELCEQMVSLAYDIVKATSTTERKETDMGNYKRTDEAQERIKMMMVESEAALEDFAGSRMSYLIIRCLRSYKNLADADDAADYFNADYYKRTAAKRIEVVVKHGSRTPSLRGHEINRTAIAQVIDTLLTDLDAYENLDVYQLMNMYLEACTEAFAA